MPVAARTAYRGTVPANTVCVVVVVVVVVGGGVSRGSRASHPATIYTYIHTHNTHTYTGGEGVQVIFLSNSSKTR